MINNDNSPSQENTIDLSFVRPGCALHWVLPQGDRDDGPFFDGGWVTNLDFGANTLNADNHSEPCDVFVWPDCYRDNPVGKYERTRLHILGKSDEWINAHISDRLIAEAVIFELARATQWAVDNMTWAFSARYLYQTSRATW